jgi:hypothetical protein
MPRNGSGTYTLPASSWNPATTATTIESSGWNTTAADLASAMTQSVSKDGQTPMTGNLPMGGNKLTGMADGATATDSATYGQTLHTSGNQSLSGNLVLSGDLTVTGSVIFSQGSLSLENLSVASTASITALRAGSLTVTGATILNTLAVASTGSVATLTANVMAVASTTSLKTLTTTGTATLATASVGSSIVIGAATGGSKGAGTLNATGIYVNGAAVGGVQSSAGSAISLSAANAWAHGLGSKPKNFGAYIVMGASTELGYTNGDSVNVADFQNGASNARAVSVKADATNVTITWSSSAPFLLNTSTFSAAAIDTTKWTVVLWAQS